MSRLWVAFVVGQLVGQLGWIDVLFIPLVLLGPLVVGAVAAAKGLPVTWPVVLWFSAGLAMLWTDWLVNREDVVFHLGVAVVTALLAAAAWAVTSLVIRRRTSTA
jgi:hypothetical protein